MAKEAYLHGKRGLLTLACRRYDSISQGLFRVYNRSLLPYDRPLLTLTHTHTAGQSASIFQQRFKRLWKRSETLAEFVFLDGPHTLPPREVQGVRTEGVRAEGVQTKAGAQDAQGPALCWWLPGLAKGAAHPGLYARPLLLCIEASFAAYRGLFCCICRPLLLRIEASFAVYVGLFCCV